ncbi:hypothetical protein ACFQZ4_17880 [Catellatospora coxensis]
MDFLVRESGCAVPTGEAFTACWIDAMRNASDADVAVRDSPYTAALVPMLFTHDRLGSRLDYEYEQDARGFVPALIRLGAGTPPCAGCSSRAAGRGCCAGASRGAARVHPAARGAGRVAAGGGGRGRGLPAPGGGRQLHGRGHGAEGAARGR